MIFDNVLLVWGVLIIMELMSYNNALLENNEKMRKWLENLQKNGIHHNEVTEWENIYEESKKHLITIMYDYQLLLARSIFLYEQKNQQSFFENIQVKNFFYSYTRQIIFFETMETLYKKRNTLEINNEDIIFYFLNANPNYVNLSNNGKIMANMLYIESNIAQIGEYDKNIHCLIDLIKYFKIPIEINN